MLRAKGCHGRLDDPLDDLPLARIGRGRAALRAQPLGARPRKADLIVIDECSMVDEELGRDLLSFGKPVLVLGDPAQLPPVKGGGFFTEAEPDVMLTEVHRQAQRQPDRPPVDGGARGRAPAARQPWREPVIRRREIDAAEVIARRPGARRPQPTRRLYNARIRELNRLPRPHAGGRREARVPAQRQDQGAPQRRHLDGAGAAPPRATDFVRMDVCRRTRAGGGRSRCRCCRSSSRAREDEIPLVVRRESDEFTYGYALTVHKAQGSQWDDVVLFDESYAFREHRSRWLYTGLTRAAERITVVVYEAEPDRAAPRLILRGSPREGCRHVEMGADLPRDLARSPARSASPASRPGAGAHREDPVRRSSSRSS